MPVSEVHPLNAFSPMEVTESGMVTLSSDLQFKNTEFPMEVTESGIVTWEAVR